jgi:hypothetical protein
VSSFLLYAFLEADSAALVLPELAQVLRLAVD